MLSYTPPSGECQKWSFSYLIYVSQDATSHDSLEGASQPLFTPPIVMIQTMWRHMLNYSNTLSFRMYWKHSHMVWKKKRIVTERRRKWALKSSMLTWHRFTLTICSQRHRQMNAHIDTSVYLGTCWRNWLGWRGDDTERDYSQQWHSKRWT